MKEKRSRRAAAKIIRPGDTLPTCPQGHFTCFPRSCPVCRAMAIPYQGLDGVKLPRLVQVGSRVWREAA